MPEPADRLPEPEDARRQRWRTGEQWRDRRRPLHEPPPTVAPPPRTGALPFVIVGFAILCVGSLVAAGAGPIAFLPVTGLAAVVVGVIALARGSLPGFLIRGRRTALIILGTGLVLVVGAGSAIPLGSAGFLVADTHATPPSDAE
jgi:hypothetical protein